MNWSRAGSSWRRACCCPPGPTHSAHRLCMGVRAKMKNKGGLMTRDECELLASQTANEFGRSMGRRRFIASSAVVALWPMAVRSQQLRTVARIGHLTAGSNNAQAGAVFVDAFRAGLRERGYVEGQNIE